MHARSAGHSAAALIGFLGACFAISALGALATAGSVDTWYRTLAKPSFNPPNWIFGPVWSVLYIMIGIAGGLLWMLKSQYPELMVLFFIQLIFNFAWSFIFFGAHRIGLALIDIFLMWVFIGLTILFSFWAVPLVAYLLFPYFLWVSFAAVLNVELWRLNR